MKRTTMVLILIRDASSSDSAIPICDMRVFYLPESVCNNLTKLTRHF